MEPIWILHWTHWEVFFYSLTELYNKSIKPLKTKQTTAWNQSLLLHLELFVSCKLQVLKQLCELPLTQKAPNFAENLRNNHIYFYTLAAITMHLQTTDQYFFFLFANLLSLGVGNYSQKAAPTPNCDTNCSSTTSKLEAISRHLCRAPWESKIN